MLYTCVLIVLHYLRSAAKLIFKAAETPPPKIAQKPSDSYNLLCVILTMFITTITHKTFKLIPSVIRQEHEKFIKQRPFVSIETLVLHVTCSTWKAWVPLEADA